MADYYNGAGQRVAFGKEIGRGGEGIVYALAARTDQVAKVYSRALDADKQTKLRLMPSKADAPLMEFAAWPLDTIHNKPNGPPVGFLMPNIGTRAPIHMLYGPAYRRQNYPDAAWNFLLFVARNTAAAFEVLHARGHVLGDVNQGNVMVGRDSKVVLIDCDSYQVEMNGRVHYCEVGVSHFTPPELQGTGSFRGIKRTANHDNFGLALLIFHLLFGGRHPYSGVPLRKDVGESLEDDIKAFRYAYSPDAAKRGVSPPPNSIPVNLVPAPLRTMFEAAFLEAGARGARPTAHQWCAALDFVRGHLSRCTNTKMHIYPDHLTACPWCQLEERGVVYFLALDVSVLPGVGFAPARVWAAIEAVRAPVPLTLRNYDNVSVVGASLPPGVLASDGLVIARLLIFGIAIGLALVAPRLWFVFVALAVAASMATGRPKARAAEKKKRESEFFNAKVAYTNLQAQNRVASNFNEKKAQLVAARDEWMGLDRREAKELENLRSTARARQRRDFLSRFFIDDAKIAGVGPAKKAALRSFGIETAADIDWHRVIQVRGFGEALTNTLVVWKSVCERQFVFDANKAVSPADVAAVKTTIAVRRRALESSLTAGVAELQRIAREATVRGQALEQQLIAAGHRLAQASADLKML